MSQDDWDRLVEEWNAMVPEERLLAADRCRQSGHNFLPCPAGWIVCVCCLMYRPVE
jgi:hypothetical protein